jgi:very-short-patch-repair endonuclease
VTEGVDRRQTGTHYTPRNLTEEIVQYTLEPLVFEGVAEGKPKEQWRLRSAAELLQLKICDMAMGSGAFLVQTCRYLAGKLVEAWAAEIPPHPPNPLLPQGAKGEQEVGTNAGSAPLALDGRGVGGEGEDHWEVPEALKQKMLEVAREFRKQPTSSEEILWQALRSRKLDDRKFRRQQPIGSFVVDFFCASEQLIVEVDGGIHETQQDLDRQRQELLESLGLRFVRVSSQLVETNLPKALGTIRKAFAPHPPNPLLPQGAKGEQEVGTNAGSALLALDGRGAGGEGDKGIGSDNKIRILPDGSLAIGEVSEHILPTDRDEQLLIARRIVADRCLYGVDKNPLAVEMAKLSLWLVTLAKGRPFTFLDHALKWGDSLLGITRAEQIEYLNLNPDNEVVQYPIASQIWRPILQDAIAKRRKLESFSVNGIEDLQEKERLFQEAERAIDRLRFVGDYLIGRALADAGKTSDLTTEDLMVVSQLIEKELKGTLTEEEKREVKRLKADTQRMINLGNPANQPPRRPFHWLLEFPEVFLLPPHPLTPSPTGAEGEQEVGINLGSAPLALDGRGAGGEGDNTAVRTKSGFDAIVGNPPFQGGQKITGAIGTDYRNFLVEFLANGQRGSADLCAYFFLQANRLTNISGGFGLVATNTIAQGDTREVGLDQLVANGCVIYRAVPSRPWIGAASLEVAYLWLCKQQWQSEYVLDEKVVTRITSFLTTPGKSVGKPYQLLANQDKSYIGSYVLGMGFVLTPDETQVLIEKDPKNKDVLFPYLNGEDLNSRPDQSPSRWVINFKDWALDAEHDDPKKPKGAPYAADYPDCLAIVREKVKPERDKNNRAVYRDKWWHYAEKRPALYPTIEEMERVLVAVQTSKFLSLSFQLTGIVYSHMTVVFALEDYASFSVLNASWHTDWIVEYCSSLETRLRYLPSDGFETFPFPKPNPSDLSTQFPTLSTIGETYYTHRQAVMRDRQEGLTKTYNRFHDPNETADDIQKLRELHIEMDYAVAAAYGWHDLLPPHPLTPSPTSGEGEQEVAVSPLALDGRGAGGEGGYRGAGGEGGYRGAGGEGGLGHDFHTTKQGIRFTISETARREVLDRLLELNHQRYAEEVAQGLHDKKKAKGKGQKTKGKTSKKQQPDAKSGDEQLKLL